MENKTIEKSQSSKDADGAGCVFVLFIIAILLVYFFLM
jgi:hypothetical protein